MISFKQDKDDEINILRCLMLDAGQQGIIADETQRKICRKIAPIHTLESSFFGSFLARCLKPRVNHSGFYSHFHGFTGPRLRSILISYRLSVVLRLNIFRW